MDKLKSSKRLKFLVYGYYGQSNTGDEAMLKVIIRELYNRYPNCEIRVSSGDPQRTEEQFKQFKVVAPMIPAFQRKGRANLKSEWSFFLELMKIDVLIYGGGTFLQDYGIKWTNMFVRFIRTLMAKLLRKKIVSIGTGASNVETTFGKILCRLIIRLTDITVLRDKDSMSFLKALGIPESKLKLSADLTFLLDICHTKTESFDEKKTLNIGISLLPFYEDILKSKGKSVQFRKNLVTNLNMILDKFNANLYFISMKGGERVNDARFAESIFKEMSNQEKVTILKYNSNVEETFSIIRAMDFAIGMRLHFLIFCFMANVPSIALSYNTKVKSFMESIEMGKWCVDEPMSIKDGKLYDLFCQMVKQKGKYPNRENKIKEFKKLAEENFFWLNKVIRYKK